MSESMPVNTVTQTLLSWLASASPEAHSTANISAALGIDKHAAGKLIASVFDADLEELEQHRHAFGLHTPGKNQASAAPELVRAPFKLRLSDSAEPSAVDQLGWGLASGWFGTCLLGWTAYGVCWLDLNPQAGSENDLQHCWSAASLARDDAAAGRRADQVFTPDSSSPPLHLRGTAFQLRVWELLLKVPAGSTISYGQLSEKLGFDRQSARAIGGAVAANRLAIVVPCHRVLPASGAIGGFRWGPTLKWALLVRESIAARRLARRAA